MFLVLAMRHVGSHLASQARIKSIPLAVEGEGPTTGLAGNSQAPVRLFTTLLLRKLCFWGYNKEYNRLNLCRQGACSCMKAIIVERHSTLLQKHKEADISVGLRAGGVALP